jgi:hypothetical protein
MICRLAEEVNRVNGRRILEPSPAWYPSPRPAGGLYGRGGERVASPVMSGSGNLGPGGFGNNNLQPGGGNIQINQPSSQQPSIPSHPSSSSISSNGAQILNAMGSTIQRHSAGTCHDGNQSSGTSPTAATQPSGDWFAHSMGLTSGVFFVDPSDSKEEALRKADAEYAKHGYTRITPIPAGLGAVAQNKPEGSLVLVYGAGKQYPVLDSNGTLVWRARYKLFYAVRSTPNGQWSGKPTNQNAQTEPDPGWPSDHFDGNPELAALYAKKPKRMYDQRPLEGNSRDAQIRSFNHFVELLQQRSFGILAPRSEEEVLDAVKKIKDRMGGGGGDYGPAVKARVEEVVRYANQLGYDIKDPNVQSDLSSITSDLVGLGYTSTIGGFTHGSWAGGGFLKDKKT